MSSGFTYSIDKNNLKDYSFETNRWKIYNGAVIGQKFDDYINELETVNNDYEKHILKQAFRTYFEDLQNKDDATKNKLIYKVMMGLSVLLFIICIV